MPLTTLLRMGAAALSVLLGAPGSFAADPESPRFTRLSVEDGLSQSSVQEVLQDRKGFIWFGTQEGLNRFDGYRFVVHRARERDGFLRDHDIQALVDDADGNLWVGTARGLYRYDLTTGRFDGVAPPVDGLAVADLVRGADRLIYFASTDGRMWVVDPASAPLQARALDSGPFAALQQVTALAPGPDATLWAIASGRLFKVEGANGRVTPASGDLGAITVVAADARGHLWLGGRDLDLLRYRPADGSVDRFPQVPRGILSILPAKGGHVWIGARRGGLTRLDPATGSAVTYRHEPGNSASLVGNDVASLYEDASGSLWIGSWNAGVSRFDPYAQAMETLRPQAGVDGALPAGDVTVMLESANGSLWTLTRSGVVAIRGAGDRRFRTVATVTDRTLTHIAPWDGRVLVGSSRGLLLFDGAGGQLPLAPALRQFSDRPIEGMRAAAGTMWIAMGTSMFRVAGGSSAAPLSVERFETPLTATISAMSMAGADELWIGSEAGEVARVDWRDPAAVTVRPIALADPARASLAAHGYVTNLYRDEDGRLWIGTRRGLGRIDVAAGTASWLEDRLPSSVIAGVVPGADGMLWIAHNRGLTRLDPESTAMTHFGNADGAQGNGYADGAWAAGASGLLYFGGEGITVFDPRRVGVSPAKPKVVFTALEILHRPVSPRWLDPESPLEHQIDAHDEITLGPDANVFAVEITPLHYADPASNRLMYRLDGFDRDWIETDARNRLATYTNLAPGRYVLRARAGTRNSVWSEGDATLVIQLLPPWWRTPAALALWIALGLGAVALLWTEARRRARLKLALLERETLRRESLTDSLTGLHNRRFLISWLDQEVPKLLREYRAQRGANGTDLLFVLVDVDHFKAINDRYSHAVGDRVLSRVAAALKDGIRGSDLAVRWGGDEFLVVIRGLQRERAGEYAERLRAAVESRGTGAGADRDPGATVSIGYAAFPFLPHDPEAISWQQTLELADHALALTKRRQRNSHTGLDSTAAVTAASVVTFLSAGGSATLPAGVESIAHDAPSS